MVLKSFLRKNKFLQPIKPSKIINKKFLTLDIETRVINNKQVPFALCIYDGFQVSNYFITDFNNVSDMFL
jgi:hypothetical protein